MKKVLPEGIEYILDSAYWETWKNPRIECG